MGVWPCWPPSRPLVCLQIKSFTLGPHADEDASLDGDKRPRTEEQEHQQEEELQGPPSHHHGGKGLIKAVFSPVFGLLGRLHPHLGESEDSHDSAGHDSAGQGQTWPPSAQETTQADAPAQAETPAAHAQSLPTAGEQGLGSSATQHEREQQEHEQHPHQLHYKIPEAVEHTLTPEEEASGAEQPDESDEDSFDPLLFIKSLPPLEQVERAFLSAAPGPCMCAVRASMPACLSVLLICLTAA